MLAKFRYSARFMKSEPEFHTCSQVLQPVFRDLTPSSCTSSSTKNPTPVDAVSVMRSVRIDEKVDGNFHGNFQKSQSIGKFVGL